MLPVPDTSTDPSSLSQAGKMDIAIIARLWCSLHAKYMQGLESMTAAECYRPVLSMSAECICVHGAIQLLQLLR